MSVTPTHNVDINDVISFFEEPTVGGNTVGAPTLTALPVIDSFNETKAWENDAGYVFGSEDIYDIVPSKKQNTLELTYRLIATDFMRRGTEIGTGTGTIGKTISIIQPLKLNGAQYYKRYSGLITDTVGIDIGNYYTITHSFLAKKISNYMTLDELKLDLGMATNGTLTFPSAPTTRWWSGLSPNPSTTTPLTIDGNTYQMVSGSISVERNPTPADAVGNDTFFHVKSGYRKVSGSFSLYLSNKQLETLLDNFSKVIATFKFNDSPNCDATLTDIVITNKDEAKTAGDNSYIMQDIQYTATSFTITNVAQ
jgi:hypothetical protein